MISDPKKYKLSDNFTLYELTYSATAESKGIDNTPPDELLPTLVNTAQMLERIRNVLNVPLKVTSGYRSPKLNGETKDSSKTSHHMGGYAADFQAPRFGTPYEIAAKLAPMIKELGIGQLIFEYSGKSEWVHVSTHPSSHANSDVITMNAKTRAVEEGIVQRPGATSKERKIPVSASPSPAKTSTNETSGLDFTPLVTGVNNLFTRLASMVKGVNNLLTRGVVKTVKATTKMQILQLGLLADEVKDNVEHFEPYGFTSHPLPGAEHVSLFFDGDRSHGATIVVADRRYRLTTLKAGEVALYDNHGNKAHFLADGTLAIAASTKVQITSPLVTMSGNLKVTGKLEASGSIESNVSVTAPQVTGTTDVTFGPLEVKGTTHIHSGGANGNNTGVPQ